MDVVVPGTEPIQADLVFVHGLRGDRIKTWESDKVFWPRDLLPKELPNVRIMSYGYDANVMNFFSNVSQSSIFQHSTNFLENLQRKRRRVEEKKRPIIFIGHSLGGLVIKDAICKSNHYKENPHHQRTAAIYRSTYGIVFLGTPHRGGNHTAWASIATNLATTVLKDHNSKVVDALKRGSETLERIQDSFCNVVGQIHIWSYFEDLGYRAARKIVDDDSATLGLPSERKEWIRANHSDMCKFSNENDYGYVSVSGGISELVEDAVAAAAAGSTTIRHEQASLPMRVKPEPPATSISMTKNTDSQAQIETPHHATAQVFSSVHRNRAPPTSVNAQDSNNSTSFLDPIYAKSIPSQYHKANDDAFIEACKKKDVETARRLLEAGTSPDTVSRADGPALWLAYAFVKYDSGRPLWRLLLDFKADAEVKLKCGRTMLMVTAGSRKLAETQTLLQYGANPNASNKYGFTPLLIATRNEDVDVIQALIKAGADANASDVQGLTSLMHAARKGHVDVIQALIKAGADANASDVQGMTSLMHAARQGHVDVVRALLEAGADINASDKNGWTPLICAAISGYVDAIQASLEAGAGVNASDRDGVTSLVHAATQGHVDIVQALLKAGADVNTQDCWGRSVLRKMSLNGTTMTPNALELKTPNGEEVMKILLAAGARA